VVWHASCQEERESSWGVNPNLKSEAQENPTISRELDGSQRSPLAKDIDDDIP